MVQIVIKIIPALQNIASLSVYLPLVFFFVFRKKNNSRALRVIFIYTLYCIINDGLSYYLFVVLESKNYAGYILYNIVPVVEFGFISYVIAFAINKKRFTQILIVTFLAFFCLAIWISFFSASIYSITSLLDGIKGVFTISFCIYFFYDQLRKPDSILLYTTQLFWIIIAFLIYVAGTFFLYLLAENEIENPAFRNNYVIINSAFIIIKNILLCVAMTMTPPPPTTATDPDKFLSEDWSNFQSQNKLN